MLGEGRVQASAVLELCLEQCFFAMHAEVVESSWSVPNTEEENRQPMSRTNNTYRKTAMRFRPWISEERIEYER